MHRGLTGEKWQLLILAKKGGGGYLVGGTVTLILSLLRKNYAVA